MQLALYFYWPVRICGIPDEWWCSLCLNMQLITCPGSSIHYWTALSFKNEFLPVDPQSIMLELASIDTRSASWVSEYLLPVHIQLFWFVTTRWLSNPSPTIFRTSQTFLTGALLTGSRVCISSSCRCVSHDPLRLMQTLAPPHPCGATGEV